MQQAEESPREHRTGELIEIKRQSEEQIPEGHAAQQRGHRPAHQERPVPGVAPARISDLVAIDKSRRTQDERHQQNKHGKIQARERGCVQPRPGREHRTAAENEPHLVAFPHRLDGFEQRATLLVGASHEAKDRPHPQIEAVQECESDQERPQDQPPDHPQSCVVGHLPPHLQCASAAVGGCSGGQ